MMIQYAFVLLAVGVVFQNTVCEEPKCSKFDYEEKLLEKVIRMEINFENVLNEMKAAKQSVKTELDALKTERAAIVKEITGLRQDLEDLNKTNMPTIQDTFHKYEAQIKKISEDLTAFQNKSLIQGSPTVPRVEFRVRNIADNTPSDGQVMKFKTVDENQGNGYNRDTGYFTAPITGNYLIMTQICLLSDNYMFFDIEANGIVLTSFQASATGRYYCGSWLAAAFVEKGSMVALISRRHLDKNVFQSSDKHQNRFSGILLNIAS